MSVEEAGWLLIEHESAIGKARRTASELASRLGLGERIAAEVGIVASELASNQLKHAGGGAVVIQACRGSDGEGLRILALDSGAGIGDVASALVDGNSSGGTLGIGLGALVRLAKWYDLYSLPGRGTVVAAAFGSCGGPLPDGAWAAGITRPMAGQEVCGDAYASRSEDGVLRVVLADGLGHGPLAASAAQAVVRAFREAPAASPAAMLRACHAGASSTRGAAVAIAQLESDGTVVHAGIGNISGQLVGPERERGMISFGGIVGVNARTVREARYQLPVGGALVLHSDGVSSKASPLACAGLLGHSPPVVAAALLRDFGVNNDDASVLVATPPEAP